MGKKHIFIANWKTYLSHKQALEWCTNNAKKLSELAREHTIILCPSYTEIEQIKNTVSNNIAVGAQTCSSQPCGAYTGQVPAESLAQLGVQFCLIGHSESRRYQCETKDTIIKKIEQLKHVSITPILCVSETFSTELEYIFKTIKDGLNQIFIAYEPTHAIGSGNTATHDEITNALTQIKNIKDACAPQVTASYLYGGSVSPQSIAELKTNNIVDGFLIGKASTNAEQFEHIITG